MFDAQIKLKPASHRDINLVDALLLCHCCWLSARSVKGRCVDCALHHQNTRAAVSLICQRVQPHSLHLVTHVMRTDLSWAKTHTTEAHTHAPRPLPPAGLGLRGCGATALVGAGGGGGPGRGGHGAAGGAAPSSRGNRGETEATPPGGSCSSCVGVL